MRKSIWALMALVSSSALAGEYVKPNGLLTLQPRHDGAEFSINAAYDASGVCNMEGNAEPIPPNKTQRNRWVFDDQSSQCMAVFSENMDRTINVTTKGCEAYCGMSAIGAMDGLYKNK